MTYVTVMAIKRNYDWSKVTAVATAATQKAIGKVQEKVKKAQEKNADTTDK